MNEEIIYFELNNWCCGEHYPNAEPFLSWLQNDLNQYFNNEKWVKENKLCVVFDIIDMSCNYCITATKKWVNENCPELLTKYRQFLRFPDKFGDVEPFLGSYFCDYSEENFGVHDGFYE